MVTWNEEKQQALVALLEGIVSRESILFDEPMSKHTTFEIGGPADVYVIPHSLEDLAHVCRACKDTMAPLYVVGCGSDLLVADAGLRGVVVQVADNLSQITVQDDILRVQAGATNAQVAETAQMAGLSGYEFACGIPGSIGGAAIMNAGAYNGEFKDACVELTCIDAEGSFITITRQDADWGYRHSMMSDAGYVVAEAVLQLHPDDPIAIRARMDELQAKRADKQPLELPSAGSTFKRPEGHFAGKLIQDSGMQGHRVGGAQVSTKHAGFVVNVGNASAADVLNLITDVQAAVRDRYGVELEPEVRMWGF